MLNNHALPKQIELSREVKQQLDQYIKLLLKWNKAYNLISKKDESQISSRHVADSIMLAKYLPEEARLKAMDIGSGAGFPGMVLAIIAPDMFEQVALVERNGKKAAFLEKVKNDLELFHVKVIDEDVERAVLGLQDVIIARGFARIKNILDVSTEKFDDKTKFILPKGKDIDGELAELRSCYSAKIEIQPSDSREDSKVVILTKVTKHISEKGA